MSPTLDRFRSFMKGKPYKKNTKIDGKVVIITGASSGIGKQTAIELAKRGGKIYFTCSDLKKGQDTLNEIKKESKSDKIHFLQLDLASLDSVRNFSQKFHQLETQLDVLINNDGIILCSHASTKDGFEMQLGTNYLGHFLLTNLLLDLLKAATPSRVIIISAFAHKFGDIRKDDLMSENSYGRFKAYFQCKLANNLFSQELAKKLEGTGVTSNSLHPGIIIPEMNTDFFGIAFLKSVYETFTGQFVKTSVEGAQTTICLAVDPELEKVSGKYFNDCKEAVESNKAKDEELSLWLWKKSEELVGLNSV